VIMIVVMKIVVKKTAVMKIDATVPLKITAVAQKIIAAKAPLNGLLSVPPLIQAALPAGIAAIVNHGQNHANLALKIAKNNVIVVKTQSSSPVFVEK